MITVEFPKDDFCTYLSLLNKTIRELEDTFSNWTGMLFADNIILIFKYKIKCTYTHII